MFTPCFFLSLFQNPTLRRLLLTALFVASLLTTLFATSLLAASLLTTLFAASFLVALFVASTFGLATSFSQQARKRTLPLLVPVDDAEQASEDEQFQWIVGEKAVVPEEGTKSHELTKVVVSGSYRLLTLRDNSRILLHHNFSAHYRTGHFDDVERAPILPSKPPKETKEMDEKKSKKGLAEIYEEEYAQKTGLAPALLSASDKLKIEVIEDMSIQVNVPALAMEEVAPLAVSDAAMLAPEEIFHGKGNIKEEAELTKEERKRRRANQKRRFR
ncbi:hypothetical protein ZIOFF_001982 [Zingiber officinale]|uniref:Transmembrane protein n=1 Tax=Zingiber officinale TaxID=94328 RepID=A0A8J5HVM0_ZINOF|nr:hypothetical protein ZIOFF_001982 [Zingiber officinale]